MTNPSSRVFAIGDRPWSLPAWARRRANPAMSPVRAVRFHFLGTVALLLLTLATAPATRAAEQANCATAELVLWGDGRHDDTRALNAWFNGKQVIWAVTGQPIGAEIAGRAFLLSSTVYIPSGTGRRLEQFQLIWPARREKVAGVAILTGNDPDKPAATIGVVKVGAAPDEGVPYAAPPRKIGTQDTQASCLVSESATYSAASAL
jgi:hypothetical protein